MLAVVGAAALGSVMVLRDHAPIAGAHPARA